MKDKTNPIVPPMRDVVNKKIRTQLHISGINMLNDCGVRYSFRYMLGIKRPPNAFLLVGKTVDSSVTKDLDTKIDSGELMKDADVQEFAAAEFEQQQKSEPVELELDQKREGLSLEQVLGEAKDKSVGLALVHHQVAAPTIRPYSTRRRFSVDLTTYLRSRAKDFRTQMLEVESTYAKKLLDNLATSCNAAARDGIDFVGEQDVVEKYDAAVESTDWEEGEVTIPSARLVIRDTKTSAKSPTPSLLDGADKPGVADDSDQLTGYAVASYVVDGQLPDMMVLDYLVQTSAGKRYYKPTRTTRNMDDFQVFMNRLVNAVHAIRSGVFVPANAGDWRCSAKWCGFHDICPYAKRPKLVTISKGVSE